MAEGKIIVFRYFDTTIDANIVKTKLDAYGIPCFLTEENMANLYPGAYNLMAFRVRLHLFEHDVDSATKILEENPLSLDEESVTSCPKCNSRKVEKDLSWNFLLGSILALTGFAALPPRRTYHCLYCGHEFK
jgi:hypothetical protein